MSWHLEGRERAPYDPLERAIRATIRARALLALQRGWLPLGLLAAYAQLERAVELFAHDDEQFADADSRGVYAALARQEAGAAEELEEVLVALVVARMAPAPPPSPALLARLAAIPQEGRAQRETRDLPLAATPPIAPGQPFLATNLLAGRAGAGSFATASADADPTAARATPVAIDDEAGTRLGQFALSATPDPDGRWRVALELPLVEFERTIAAWRIDAQLGPEPLAGDWHADRDRASWQLQTALTDDELAALTLQFTPPGRE